MTRNLIGSPPGRRHLKLIAETATGDNAVILDALLTGRMAEAIAMAAEHRDTFMPWFHPGMKPPAPPRVEIVETHWTIPPFVLSSRCLWWRERILAGWRPVRFVARLDYRGSAEYFGVYIWEWQNVLYRVLHHHDESDEVLALVRPSTIVIRFAPEATLGEGIGRWRGLDPRSL